jgi:hypothetical protein
MKQLGRVWMMFVLGSLVLAGCCFTEADWGCDQSTAWCDGNVAVRCVSMGRMSFAQLVHESCAAGCVAAGPEAGCVALPIEECQGEWTCSEDRRSQVACGFVGGRFLRGSTAELCPAGTQCDPATGGCATSP